MAKTKADALNIASPTNLADLLREVAPALLSSLESNLPLSARDANAVEIAVASDTTGAMGDADTGSGFAGEVLACTDSTGAAPGAKTIVAGVPAAGECQVTYDAYGIPTANFNAADAITDATFVVNKTASDMKRTLASEATM